MEPDTWVPSVTTEARVTSAKLQYLLSVPVHTAARNDSNHLWNSLARGKLVPHVEMLRSRKWCDT